MSQTWDGKPISEDPPFGATIIVYRRRRSELEFLLLHRAHAGPDFEGDWAWTPPAGARRPGESIELCAQRELSEEAGLRLVLRRLNAPQNDWAIFSAEVIGASAVMLHDNEHDRFEWVCLAEALRRCKPERAAIGFGLAYEMLE